MLGHAVLLEGLLAVNKIRDGARVGELYDQSAFSSYYGDEELQAEATRVVRTAAMR